MWRTEERRGPQQSPFPEQPGKSAPAGRLRRARAALLGAFFVNGAALGIWVPHIPIVQTRLGIGPGALGFALLGLGAGALAGMPAAGMLVARYGSRKVTTPAAVLFPVIVLMPIFARTFGLLAAGLVVFGSANGLLDVAMNTHAVGVERRYGRSIMASFHASWSFGGLTGAMAAGFALEGIAPDTLRTAALVLPLFSVALLSSGGLLRDLSDAGGSAPTLALPSKALLGLGAVAFFALVGEGAMADWSAVYLHTELGAGSSVSAAGFGAFSLAMATGRLLGDALIRGAGHRAVLRWSGRAGVAGMSLALLVPQPLVVLIGFALVGIGAANIVPILFASAGRVNPDSPGRAVAAVAAISYLGLLAGPILIGTTAELVNLPTGLALVAVAYFAVSLGAGAVRA